MNPLIAFCGLDCSRCEARTATLHNDNALREQVARQWSEWNHVDIPAASINCLGCRTEGVKCPYCDSMCPIRQCALRREVSHCGECPESPDCHLLQQVHSNAPEARAQYLLTTLNNADSPSSVVAQLNIAEVAYELGFSNPAAFSRYFYMHMGVRPKEWRKCWYDKQNS